MDARGFHSLAERLVADTGAKPADCRTAVCRAYYSAYHMVLAEVSKLGCTPTTGERAHARIREQLNSTGDHGLKKLTADLADLQASRREADYDLNKPKFEGHKTAQAVVAQAKSLIHKFVARFQEADKKALAAAMNEWTRVQGGKNVK